MSSMEIRRCEAGDLPVVLDLLKQLDEVVHAAMELRLELLAGTMAEMDEAPQTYLNLVAVVEGRVVGYISVVFYKSLYHKGGTALIEVLVVSRDWRGSGVGSALVQKAKEEAIARGMDELEVGTERDNQIARRFYRKCGFDEEYVLLGMEFQGS
jgi:GNAT superfamily N-acetyltransferase